MYILHNFNFSIFSYAKQWLNFQAKPFLLDIIEAIHDSVIAIMMADSKGGKFKISKSRTLLNTTLPVSKITKLNPDIAIINSSSSVPGKQPKYFVEGKILIIHADF